MKVKPWLSHLKPYPPGKTLEEILKESGSLTTIYKLNSNENPLGPSPKVIEALRKSLSEIHLYPEASYLTLRKALSEKWEVFPEEVILGNGSNEVIEFLFKAYLFEGDEIIVSEPSFLMYTKFAEIYGVNIKRVSLTGELCHDLEGILKALSPKTKMIFLDHPHNPTGQCLKRKDWEAFFQRLPKEVLVVMDEAYGEFIEDEEVPLGIEFIKKGYPVMVVRTFSKFYGLAGLRLGYGLGRKEIIQELEKVRQPFNVNLLAVKAGLSVLSDLEYQKKTRELVLTGRKFLTKALSELGFKVYPSEANFIMGDFGKRVDQIYEALLSAGIFVRPLKAYGFPTSLRITIGIEEANAKLIEVIKRTISG